MRWEAGKASHIVASLPLDCRGFPKETADQTGGRFEESRAGGARYSSMASLSRARKVRTCCSVVDRSSASRDF